MKKTSPTPSVLAKKLGVSRQLINAHRKSGPPLSDMKGWKIFLAAIGREGSLPKDLRERIGLEKLRIAKADASRKELELAQAREEVMATSTVQAFVRELVAVAFFGELNRLAAELPVQLKGKSEVEINVALEGEVRNVAATVHATLDAWGRGEAPEFVLVRDTTGNAELTADAENHQHAVRERMGGDWLKFVQWRKEQHAMTSAQRWAWCASRAKAGLPVPDASEDELAQHPGLTKGEVNS